MGHCQELETIKGKRMTQVYLTIRQKLYSFLAQFDHITGRKAPLIILCYHSISSDSWRYGITKEAFKKQMAYIEEHFAVIPLSEVTHFLDGSATFHKPAAVITFDDGYSDILEIRDYVRQHHIQPTLFLIGNTEKVCSDELQTHRSFLTKNDVLNLVSDGWEIGCHSMTHPDFHTLSESQIQYEIHDAAQLIRTQLGIVPNTFTYPKGRYTQTIVSAVKSAGFVLGLTMDDSVIGKNSNPLLLPRIGVDRTHSLEEFKTLFSPSCIRLRHLIKSSFLSRFIV